MHIAWRSGISPADLDLVGFYDKPLLKFDRLLETYLAYAPSGLSLVCQSDAAWLREKLHLRRELRKPLSGYKKRFVFLEHHESHAASAFFPSPFEEAAILTIDGVGEWATASIGRGKEPDRADFTSCGFRIRSVCLFGIHLLLRLSRELGRVQADGPGAVWRTEICRSDQASV